MKDPLRNEASRLRLQAIVLTCVCMLAACALPIVSYVFVFRYAPTTVLGPYAWALWATAGAAGALAVVAHAFGGRVLLAAHAALGGMLAAAMGGFYTAFWMALEARCATAQVAFQGCAACACAASSTCTAAQLASDAGCIGCLAYPTDVCGPLAEAQNRYVLAFSGLSLTLFLAVPVLYSLLVLSRTDASAAAAASKRRMVAFAVEQQTALVEAGDKPTVTPPTLAAWVAFLLDCGERDCVAVGDKCRAALAARGFELPVAPRKAKKGAPAGPKRRGLLRKRAADPREVAITASSSVPPAVEALSAAEAGQGAKPAGGRRSGLHSGAVSADQQFMARR